MPVDLLTRAEAGVPLTATQHDQNLLDIETLLNSLEAAMGVALNADGTLKDGAIDDADIVADSILTLAKFAAGTANCVITTGSDGIMGHLGGVPGEVVWYDPSTGGVTHATITEILENEDITSYAATAYPAINQSVTVNSVYVKTVLASTDINQESVFDTVNSRYVAPVSGVYRFTWMMQIDNNTGVASGMTVQTQLAKNGVTGFGGTGCAVASPPGSRWFMTGSALLELSATDYVELWVRGGDGTGTGAVNVMATRACTYFSAEKLTAFA